MEEQAFMNAKLETSGIEMFDDPDQPALLLSFTVKQEDKIYHFPIPLEIAEDLGLEILRITKELRVKKEERLTSLMEGYRSECWM